MNTDLALASYCQVELPETPPAFPSVFITVPERYITISLAANWNSKKYSWWQKVIDLLTESLRQNNIYVVQVGGDADKQLFNSIDYRGRASLRQIAFILENSLCHLGNDDILTLIAASKKTPTIALYGAIPSEVVKPYYQGDFKALEPHSGSKFSYSSEEPQKAIDNILPEDIAEKVSDTLKLGWVKSIKTLKINPLYGIDVIDFVPDFPIPPNVFDKQKISCRFDISNNQQALVDFYSKYTGDLYTEDPLPVELLQQFKGRITQVIYLLDKNYSKDFIKMLNALAINYELITEKKGRELGDLKLDLFDYKIVREKNPPDTTGISNEDYFESKRVYLSRGKFYATRYHLAEGVELKDTDYKIGSALGSKNFLEGWQNCLFYSKV